MGDRQHRYCLGPASPSPEGLPMSTIVRGATFSHLNSMTDGAGNLMMDVFITAGPHWYGGESNHIEVTGWNTRQIGELVEAFDSMSDDEWLCAYTLAADGWHGTPEDLINAAKELA